MVLLISICGLSRLVLKDKRLCTRVSTIIGVYEGVVFLLIYVDIISNRNEIYSSCEFSCQHTNHALACWSIFKLKRTDYPADKFGLKNDQSHCCFWRTIYNSYSSGNWSIITVRIFFSCSQWSSSFGKAPPHGYFDFIWFGAFQFECWRGKVNRQW